MNSNLIISKSRFVSGVQCEKKLYFDLFRKDLKPIITELQSKLFDKGNEVGLLAQNVFPDGVNLKSEGYLDFHKSIDKTKDHLKKGTKTLYEAAFSYDGVTAALDILHQTANEVWAIEVKSSSSVKDYHLADAALQFWVMKAAGHTPDKFFLMHINSNYVRKGAVDAKALFTLCDITAEVLQKQSWVKEKLDSLKQLNESLQPEVSIGKHCSNPFSCDYQHHCWSGIPDKNSVFELKNARGKEWELYEKGIIHLKDVPDEFALSTNQRLHINGIKTGETYIDINGIQTFLNSAQYPLYFFDFETINATIPVLERTRPFQQVPFQYSLHRLDSKSATIVHTEYLANPDNFSNQASLDPRKQLINQLRRDIGEIGNLVAYNAPFEKMVLRDLAEAFPEDAPFIENLLSRFIDLLDVFKGGYYYHPAMMGSASIKYVLPAIAPQFSYKDLDIGNGEEASSTFLSMIDGTFEGHWDETRKNLLKYCERDTYGMVVIWGKLLEITR